MWISPAVAAISPVMVRSKVVFPTPLRPRRATSSPSSTSAVMSWSTGVRPYPAETLRSWSIFDRPAQVDIENLLVLAQLLDGAATEHSTLVKHDDVGVQLPDEVHVMFHDNDRCPGGEVVDQPNRPAGFLARHPGRGFVEEDHFRVAGDDHGNLEPLPLAVCQVTDQDPLPFGDAEVLEDGVGDT